MKLPFSLGTKLIFRLLLPGLILAAVFAPAIHTTLRVVNVPITLMKAFPFEVVFWGWIIVLLDMPIYMLFEGRRSWPEFARSYFLARERARLRRLLIGAVPSRRHTDPRTYLDSNVEVAKFPLGADGDPTALRPTRLGNLIAEYEEYSRRNYGLDSVFFWYRLWVVLDKDLREEIDTSQALVDSAIYKAFGLFVSAVVLFIYAIGYQVINIVYVPRPPFLILMSIACGVAGFVVYRGSLHAHAQFGELFKAIFDQYRSKLNFDDVLKTIGRLTGEPMLELKQGAERNRIVWRYLRWHRIRPPGRTENITPEAWLREQQGAAPATPTGERSATQSVVARF